MITVISLFDGMSCGQIALNILGIKYDDYYASEIDKYAMKVTKDNYPNTIHIGDVTLLNRGYMRRLVKDKEVLLMGGSPCQGFSLAGKMKGSCTSCGIDVTTLEQYLHLKAEGFKFDGQSYLFWEFIRIKKIIEKYSTKSHFLLENVRLTKQWLPMFNDAVGITPILINSALVSAQNRKRYYWTNISFITQPNDQGILIKDILEDEVDDKYYMSQTDNYISTDGLYHIADINIKGHDQIKRVYAKEGKSPTLTTCTGGHREPKVLIVPEATKKGYIEVVDGECFDNAVPTSKTRRGRMMVRKSNALLTSNQFMRYEHPRVRKLTPLECERLQTVPEHYTNSVSNSQRYKMLGNGWTIDVIAHILKGLKNEFHYG